MQKPSVIRHVGEQIRSVQNELPGQVADGVFETNQRRDLHIATC